MKAAPPNGSLLDIGIHRRRHSRRRRALLVAVPAALRVSGTSPKNESGVPTSQTSAQCADRRPGRSPGTNSVDSSPCDRAGPAAHSAVGARRRKGARAVGRIRDRSRSAVAEPSFLPSNSNTGDRASVRLQRSFRPAGCGTGFDRLTTRSGVLDSGGAVGRCRMRPGYSCSLVFRSSGSAERPSGLYASLEQRERNLTWRLFTKFR
jgi:hypothetical protein